MSRSKADARAASRAPEIPLRMSALHLDVFNAVVVTGGVTAASRQLHLSQPAVSRRLADLERVLGFDLFLRDGKRLIITPEGKAFHEELSISYLGLEHLTKVALDIRELRRGHLRFVCMPAMSFGPVPKGLAAFSARHPDIHITHETHSAARIEDALTSNLFDVGIGMAPRDMAGLVSEGRFAFSCVCVMRPDHPLATQETVTATDICREAVVGINPDTEIGSQLRRLFESLPHSVSLRIETQTSIAACGLVEAGAGVAVVDPFTAAHLGRGGGLVSRRFSPIIPFDIHILRPERRVPSRAAQALIAELAAAMTSEEEVSS